LLSQAESSAALESRLPIAAGYRDGAKLAGRQVGCCIVPEFRFKYYDDVIEANLKLDKKSWAEAWVKRAVAHSPAPTFHEMLMLSQFAFDCGNMPLASELATRAESVADQNEWEYPKLANMWRKLGRPDKAKSTEALANKYKEQYETSRKNSETGPFSHVSFR
jgi:hypothetical protein